MIDAAPIGAVCAFAGQIFPSSGDANGAWSNSACGSDSPTTGDEDSDCPITYLEAQGWMPCDGRSLEASEYPELYAVLGTLYGQGSGSTSSFRIPDYRGLFLRGADSGAGMDPDAGDRIAPTGAGTFNGVGSLQCDAFETHTHSYDQVALSGTSNQGVAAGLSTNQQPTTEPNSPARTSSETRPKNVAVNYIIRFR
ncbi:MAG: phage tail protein [Acidobacteriota bacterium]